MEKKRLSKSQVTTFGINGFTMMLGIMVPMSYITIFMTEQLMMSAALAGTILLTARIVDFFIGITAGGVIEKTRMKHGKYRSWYRILRWVVLIGVFLQFLNTNGLPLAAQVVIVFVGYLMLHGSMDYLAPAQFGIIAMMGGTNMQDRNRLAFANARFSSLGGIVISAVALPLINLLTPIVGPSYSYTVVATAGAAMFVLGASLILKVSKPYDLPQPKVGKGEAGVGMPTVTLGDMFKSVFTNDQLLILFLGQTFYQTAAQVAMGIMAYYFMFVLGNLTLMALAMTITTAFGFIGAVVGPKVGTKLGKKSAMVIGMFTYAVMSIGIAFFGSRSLVVYIIFACAYTIGNYFFMSFGNMFYLDCGEYGYWKTGKDNRAVTLSVGNMPIKIGMALGGSLGAYGLQIIGYVPNMAPTPEFATKFMYLFGGLPAALALIGATILLFGYKLKDEDCALYASENAARAEAAKAEMLKNMS